jgi:hypothetical protein
MLITSRRRLAAPEDAAVINLDTLTPGKAAELLARLAGRPGPQAADTRGGRDYPPVRLSAAGDRDAGLSAMPSPGLDYGGSAAELAAARNRLELMQSRSQRSLPHSAWSGSLLPTTSLARIIAGDSWHRVRSPALSTLRPILKERVAPAHFHALAASPWAR